MYSGISWYKHLSSQKELQILNPLLHFHNSTKKSLLSAPLFHFCPLVNIISTIKLLQFVSTSWCIVDIIHLCNSIQLHATVWQSYSDLYQSKYDKSREPFSSLLYKKVMFVLLLLHANHNLNLHNSIGLFPFTGQHFGWDKTANHKFKLPAFLVISFHNDMLLLGAPAIVNHWLQI